MLLRGLNHDSTGDAFDRTTINAKAALRQVIVTRDSTWLRLEHGRTHRIQSARSGTGKPVTKTCKIRNASGGSLLQKGMSTAPALALVAQLMHYEPDARSTVWIRFPMRGGYKSHDGPPFMSDGQLDYGEPMDLPRTHQLRHLAGVWEKSFPVAPARQKDGYRPTPAFATYLIYVALSSALGLSGDSVLSDAEDSPRIIIVADGWNLDQVGEDPRVVYFEVVREILLTKTVGAFKDRCPVWREAFQKFSSKKKPWKALDTLNSLLRPLEAGAPAKGAVSSRP